MKLKTAKEGSVEIFQNSIGMQFGCGYVSIRVHRFLKLASKAIFFATSKIIKQLQTLAPKNVPIAILFYVKKLKIQSKSAPERS